VPDALEDLGSLTQVALTQFGAERVGPRTLRYLHRAKRGAPGRRQPQELGRAVPRVLLVDGKAVAHERVGGALHALACESVDASDLGHTRRPVPDHIQHLPPRLGLAGRLRHRVPSGDQGAVQAQRLDDQAREGGPGRSRPALAIRRFDSMLSFCHNDSILSLSDRKSIRSKGTVSLHGRRRS
jgi:hypothetical protein